MPNEEIVSDRHEAPRFTYLCPDCSRRFDTGVTGHWHDDGEFIFTSDLRQWHHMRRWDAKTMASAPLAPEPAPKQTEVLRLHKTAVEVVKHYSPTSQGLNSGPNYLKATESAYPEPAVIHANDFPHTFKPAINNPAICFECGDGPTHVKHMPDPRPRHRFINAGNGRCLSCGEVEGENHAK